MEKMIHGILCYKLKIFLEGAKSLKRAPKLCNVPRYNITSAEPEWRTIY